MAFNITPVEAPTVERSANEFDALVPQVADMQKSGQWASLPVPHADAESFKRKFREAANRAGHSAKFGKDSAADESGNVVLTFTIQDKITRKPKDETTAPAADPTPAPKPSK